MNFWLRRKAPTEEDLNYPLAKTIWATDGIIAKNLLPNKTTDLHNDDDDETSAAEPAGVDPGVLNGTKREAHQRPIVVIVDGPLSVEERKVCVEWLRTNIATRIYIVFDKTIGGKRLETEIADEHSTGSIPAEEVVAGTASEAHWMIPICPLALAFELMGDSKHPNFRQVSKSYVIPILNGYQTRRGPIVPENGEKHTIIPSSLSTAQECADVGYPLRVNREQISAVLQRADCLLVLDIQLRVYASMPMAVGIWEENVREVIIAARDGAHDSEDDTGSKKKPNIPVVITEQAPKNLGHTAPFVMELLPRARQVGPGETVVSVLSAGDTPVVAKTTFSAASAVAGFKEVCIVGLDTNICVQQTLKDLLENGQGATVILGALASCCPEDDYLIRARFGGKVTYVG